MSQDHKVRERRAIELVQGLESYTVGFDCLTDFADCLTPARIDAVCNLVETGPFVNVSSRRPGLDKARRPATTSRAQHLRAENHRRSRSGFSRKSFFLVVVMGLNRPLILFAASVIDFFRSGVGCKSTPVSLLCRMPVMFFAFPFDWRQTQTALAVFRTESG